MTTILLPKAPQECTVALTEQATVLGRNKAHATKVPETFLISLFENQIHLHFNSERERKVGSDRLDLRSPDSSCNTVQFSKQHFRGSL